ncbi:MAG: hypothetical protein WB795_01095, partial [Candidatus Acidiferrales bacterium]
VKIAREEDRERALRLLEKAKKNCLIARSVKCPVDLRPEVKVEEELLRPETVGSPPRRPSDEKLQPFSTKYLFLEPTGG